MTFRPPTAIELERLIPPERPRRWGCSLLDLRTAPVTWHLPGSAWWPHPVSPPSHFLPRRGSEVILLGPDPSRARTLAEELAQRGWTSSWLQAAFTDELRPRLEARGWHPAEGPTKGALWSPDPDLLEHRRLLELLPPGPVADLGSGNGRNAVYLAQLGRDVHAYDRLADALALGRQRAAWHGVRIHTYQQKLISWDSVPGPEHFALLLFLRFHRLSLLQNASARLLPGGLVVLSAYRAEGRGDRSHRLLPETVESLFPDDRWEILDASEGEEEAGQARIFRMVRLRSAGGGSAG